MKRIGIISFHIADNYGAVLQNYALQQAVVSLGYEAETIDYQCEKIKKCYHVWRQLYGGIHVLRRVKNRIADIVNYPQAVIRKKRFRQFRKDYLCLSEKAFDSQNISEAEYDIFITGSDQVWNKNIIGAEDTDAYTLAFTDQKKAAYAASCGDVKHLIEKKDGLSQLLKITVRETALYDELKKNNILSEVVCDPVFLLQREQWMEVSSMIPDHSSKFVFMYCVNNIKKTLPIAKYIADEKECVLRIPDRYNEALAKTRRCNCVFRDGPIEFLAEIEAAEIVVTSSFHGTVFSILMEKEFVVVLTESGDSRVRNLLQFVGLEERIVSDLDEFRRKSSLWKPIDYTKVTSKIEEWRMWSLEKLKEICEL